MATSFNSLPYLSIHRNTGLLCAPCATPVVPAVNKRTMAGRWSASAKARGGTPPMIVSDSRCGRVRESRSRVSGESGMEKMDRTVDEIGCRSKNIEGFPREEPMSSVR
jgi:hypothetical protein